jgi:hypothetical protein
MDIFLVNYFHFISKMKLENIYINFRASKKKEFLKSDSCSQNMKFIDIKDIEKYFW